MWLHFKAEKEKGGISYFIIFKSSQTFDTHKSSKEQLSKDFITSSLDNLGLKTASDRSLMTGSRLAVFADAAYIKVSLKYTNFSNKIQLKLNTLLQGESVKYMKQPHYNFD